MTLFDFACKNISRDRRNYIYYFVNCVFSVFVFFLFSVLSFHPAMRVIDTQSTMGLVLAAGEFVSVGFSLCFISYSVGCFLKGRSRQFGLITISGASKKQLNKLIFMENMIVGLSSIVVGILFGLVFSKFFLDIANKVIGVTDFQFYIPVKAILLTVFILGLVFLSISYFTPKFIRKKEVVRLLKAEVSGEKEPKLFPAAVLFVILFLASAWVVKTNSDNIFLNFILLLTGILGTYLLVSYAMRIVLAVNKNKILNTGLLCNSERKSKLRSNTQVMTLSTVLYAISFFAITILFSMSRNVKVETEKIMPCAMSYNTWKEGVDEARDVEFIDSVLKTKPGYQRLEYRLYYGEEDSREALMSVTEYNRIMKFLGREAIALKPGQTYVVSGNVGTSLTGVPDETQAFLKRNNCRVAVAGTSESTIVLSGFVNSVSVLEDGVFEALRPELTFKTIYAFDYENWENDGSTPKIISDVILAERESENKNLIYAYRYYHSSRLQNNLTLYIGSMLCFTFILAVASFIYSRLYSGLDAECKKYRGIVKIGLSEKELSHVLRKETSLILAVPFVVALLYLWIGIFISEQFVFVSNVPTAVGCTGILVIMQTVIYFVVNSAYRRAVFKKVFDTDNCI